jgi:hypothetical protein
VHTDSADRLHIIFVALCVQTIHKNQNSMQVKVTPQYCQAKNSESSLQLLDI